MGPLKLSALIFMIVVQVSVTIISFYFLYKAIKSPKKPEPDSYSENDNKN